MTKLITNYFIEDQGIYRIQSEVPSATTQEISSDFDYEQTFNYMLSTFKLGVEEAKEEEPETFEVNENLKLSNVQPDKTVQSPLSITGEARGSWYFEGVFSVTLENGNGEEISTAQAEAQGEWTTENFVPFEAELSFEEPQTDTGTLILKKANPSGMPDKAVSEEIPLKFQSAKEERASKECKTTGCSGEICSSETVETTCEALPGAQCLDKASCELVEENCKWILSEEAATCLTEVEQERGPEVRDTRIGFLFEKAEQKLNSAE